MSLTLHNAPAFRGNADCLARDIVTDDTDCLARSITGWRQEYEQIKAGPFQGSLSELCLDATQIFLEKTSLPLHQVCTVPDGFVWFGLPTSEGHYVRINGATVHPGSIAVRRGGRHFELFTPDELQFWGVVVKEDVLLSYAQQFECADWLTEMLDHPVLEVREPMKRAVQNSCSVILNSQCHALDTPLSPSLRESLSEHALKALLSLLRDAAPVCAQRKLSARKQLVEQADAYVRSSRDRLVTVAELCMALNTSRRALQIGFQEALGVSPHAYIRAVSLNSVRSHLRDAQSPYSCVQDAAAAFGFWHMSQFAQDYREMFGERPSDTLRRRGGDRQKTGDWRPDEPHLTALN